MLELSAEEMAAIDGLDTGRRNGPEPDAILLEAFGREISFEEVDYHLRERQTFWSTTKHDRWARGTRVVAKMAGVQLVALTGVLDCLSPAYDPLEVAGRIWDWRYDMRWDRRPTRTIPLSG
jgi:hypothetical protein